MIDRLARWAPLLLLAALLVVYELLFGRFFPNAAGGVGEDFAGVLPAMLSGYYWQHSAGLLAVPWLTPSLCGGLPFFADAVSFYYSVPQALTLAWDPMTSVHVTLVTFAGIGFAGTWLLLRRAFLVGRWAAAFGATVFMFNGFYAHRMVAGHIGYHGFMLLPLMAWGLLAPPKVPAGGRGADGLLRGCLVGLAAAYGVQSALGGLVLPMALALAAIVALRVLEGEGLDPRALVLRAGFAAAFAAAVSASKLAAGASFLSGFSRSQYALPGFRSLVDGLQIALLSLFVSPADIAERGGAALVNVQWPLARYELEYGVTLAPLAILAAAAVAGGIARWRRARGGPTAPEGARAKAPFRPVALALLTLALALPLAVNLWSPGWNAILKATPLLKSASALVRWFVAWVPVVAVAAALALERLPARARAAIGTAAIVAVVAQTAAADRTYYDQQGYRPEPTTLAWRAVAAGAPVPPIAAIGVHVTPDGRPFLAPDRNDLLVIGESPLYCYSPIFGYWLEWFPVKELHAGSVWDERNGRLNLKNPACYLFPRENGCRPGDHFLATEREEAERFTRYLPIRFEISRAQVVADWVTRLGLAGSLAVLVAQAFAWVRRRRGTPP
jgi:hypothetical protein